MITKLHADGPEKRISRLELVLSPKNIESILEAAAWDTDWEPGRLGGDYYKLDLLNYSSSGLSSLRNRLLTALAQHAQVPPQKLQGCNDFWLIYYPAHSIGLPRHKDEAPFGARHIRANVGVTQPDSGGKLIVEDRYLADLAPGSGIIFEPSTQEHYVTAIGDGGRLVLSVGAVISS